MYGVPEDLDLFHFVRATCIQVAIGEFQIQFHFHPSGSISVEGRWELRNADGQTVDRSRENNERESHCIHGILGKAVSNWFVNAPTSFGLQFENGYQLEIFDDSQHYETCQISPMDIII